MIKLLILIASLTLISCSRIEVDEVFYPNGKLMYRNEMKNGIKHGISFTLSAIGDTIEYGEYSNGIENGLFRQKTGNLEIISSFKNGKSHGKTFAIQASTDTIYAINYEENMIVDSAFFTLSDSSYFCFFEDGLAHSGYWSEINNSPLPFGQYLCEYDNGVIVDTLFRLF